MTGRQAGELEAPKGGMRLLTLSAVGLLFLLVTVLAVIFPRQLDESGALPSIDSVHILATALGLGVAPTLPVTLIKVDERSFAEWGQPYPMAKARLAEVVEAIRALGPTAILVDFDFSIHRDLADTARFNRLLASWSEADPPLLLPAELVAAEDVQIRRSPGVVQDAPVGAPVFWTSVLFRKDGDGKVREWRLWEPACDPGALLLSPQIIVSALVQGGPMEVSRVQQALAGQSGCAPSGATPAVAPPDWLRDVTALSPINFVFGRISQPYSDASGRPMLTEWSAVDVLEKGLAASAIANRTVIIGSSRIDDDNHLTPIGQMEGMRIIANAVATGLDVVSIRAPSLIEGIILMLLPTSLAVLMLKRLKLVFSGVAILVTSVIFFAVAARIYGPANAIGALSWSVPLVGIFFALESALQFLSDLFIRKRGWQAFLNRE